MTIAVIYYYVVLANFDIVLGLLYIRSNPGRYREPVLDRLMEMCKESELHDILGAVMSSDRSNGTDMPIRDLRLVLSWMQRFPDGASSPSGDFPQKMGPLDWVLHRTYDFFAANLDIFAVIVFSVAIPVTMFWMHLLVYPMPPFPLSHGETLLILGMGQMLPLLFHLAGVSLKYLVCWRFKRSLVRIIIWRGKSTGQQSPS